MMKVVAVHLSGFNLSDDAKSEIEKELVQLGLEVLGWNYHDTSYGACRHSILIGGIEESGITALRQNKRVTSVKFLK